jgi:hypothetical protein
METELITSELQQEFELLFEEEVNLTGISEYGVSWEDILSGKVKIPPQGVRFDIAFEGKISGEKLNGFIKGVDYLEVRADGNFILNIYASIITDDAEMISLKEDGILSPGDNGSAKLNLNMKFSSAFPQYSWLNKKQVWGVGEVNMIEGKVTVKGFTN